MKPIRIFSLLIFGILSGVLLSCNTVDSSRCKCADPHSLTSGIWVDLANAPTTQNPRCCKSHLNENGSCSPDTLVLTSKGQLLFFSIPDEPHNYAIIKDTLLHFTSFEHLDTLKIPYEMIGDTLRFQFTPLCPDQKIPAEFLYRPFPK